MSPEHRKLLGYALSFFRNNFDWDDLDRLRQRGIIKSKDSLDAEFELVDKCKELEKLLET